MQTIDLSPQHLTLSESELKKINYMYAHIDEMPFVSITQLAQNLGISSATLSRCVRRLGFASFKDLKDVIATKNRISPAYKMAQSVHHPTERYSQLFINEMEHLNETMKHLDVYQFTQALEMLHQVDKFHILGKGAAFGLAHLLNFRFNRFKKNTRLIEASGSSHLDFLHLVKANDGVVLFAFD